MKKIFEDSRKRRNNLNITLIDHQKAFDNALHSWIEKSIELRGVNDKMVKFCKLSVGNGANKLRTNKVLMK
jgi:hypothetical protein